MSFGTFHPISTELVELMTPAERAEYTRAFRRHLALQSPLDLALLTTPRTKEYPHIQLLNTLLVALVEHRLYKAGPCDHPSVDAGGNVLPPLESGAEPPMDPRFHPDVACFVEPWAPAMEKLFITMPPRHGKSYLLSEHTPAWFLARYPDCGVIFASYEAEFAGTFGAKARDIIEEHGDLFGLSVNPSARASNNFELAGRRGGMKTAGAGGPITGKGGHLLLCDDPIKNQEEALSETMREKMWDWWHATFSTRGEPGAVICLIHTRWHEDDLGGRLMAEQGDEWFHIDLPALQPEGEDDAGRDILSDTGIHSGSGNPLCREAGEALCPPRYSASWLQSKRKSNPGWFDALYQQRPSSEGAGIFQRPFRYWRQAGTPRDPLYALELPNGTKKFVTPASCYHFLTCDLAASEKKWADFTVFSLWACTPDKELLLVDRLRERIESDQHLKTFEDYVADLKRRGFRVRLAGVEKATYGLTLIKQLIRRRVLPIRKLEPDTDKITRALPAGEACSNGVVYWPAEAPWLKVWEEEHLKFPVTTHDDQVDTTAYAVYMLYFSGLAMQLRPQEPEPVTMQEKVDAKVAALDRKKRRGSHRHPELGRVW